MNPINTIDDVITTLDYIIATSINNNNPIGYFPALYRKVTIKVKEGIANNEFDDGPRMEKLDVIFATRYLTAYDEFIHGKSPTKSWEYCFLQTKKYWPIVLQDLLWGINAHINLDLGIAAAEAAPGDNIHALKNDFDKINQLLANLVGDVEEELSQIWPTLKTILALTGKADDFFINFSMKIAREGAWKFATELAAASPEEKTAMIASRDKKVKKIAKFIQPPGLIGKIIFKWIRLRETGTVADRINVLR